MADQVEDTEETRTNKTQVWRNGALSINVPPSNKRGRKSGGARVINTSKDYLIGLYFWHKPENHDAWFEKFKSCISQKHKTAADTKAAPPAVSKQVSLDKLMVSQRLKEVLCSNLVLSDANTVQSYVA